MNESFEDRGVRALVVLHERHMRAFLATWQRARRAEVSLPETDEATYVSLVTLLRHVLGAARGYMIWSCDKLGLPEPDIRRVPRAEEIEEEAEAYLEHVLAGWRDPLRGVSGDALHRPEFESAWGVNYCIDAMLEHAVMHPIRHVFQLEELMREGS